MKTRALTLICLFAAAGAALAQPAPDKASPFTAVRWDGDEPIVQFQGEWYEFEGIDDVPKADILAFAKEEHGDRWQKRFSEDLVELLTDMGHEPQVEVWLTLRKDGEPLATAAPMTEDNRRAVWRYNQGERDGDDSPRPHIDAGLVQQPVREGGANQRMAEQFAAHIDAIWEQPPAEDLANLRFLFHRTGSPFAGKVQMETELQFHARTRGGIQIHQGFNPNRNGRWVYENLEPGRYDLEIVGNGRFQGFVWRALGVDVGPNQAPLTEIELDR